MFSFRFRCVALVLLFCFAMPLIAQDISGLQQFGISSINLDLFESRVNSENNGNDSVFSESIPKTFSGITQFKWSADDGISKMASVGETQQTQKSGGGIPTWLIVVGCVVGGLLLTWYIATLIEL